MTILLIGIVVLAAIAVVAVRFLVQGAETAAVDFRTLERHTAPNDALACPAGACTAKVDLTTQPVALSADALAGKVVQLAGDEPRTVIVSRDDARHHFVLVQRSLVFAFPDTIDIEIQPVDAGHATLALYSRSKYGRGDLGVNRARVKRWLGRLGISTGG
jgi:uncharacterized protein (DUF1499 family)